MMSFASVLVALWFYEIFFVGHFVHCAVLNERIPLPSPQPDTPSGVTFVTKVVAITLFLNPSGTTTTSSEAPDPSDGPEILTKVVRVKHTPTKGFKCQPSLCTVNVASVSVYYWPQESANTACLSTISSLPSALPPPGLIPQSPSIYGIFYSLSLSNGCGTLSTTYDSITMSFTPGALSTVDPVGTTADVFNFADLPCPPSGLYVEPGQLYQPQFAPPRDFFRGFQAAHPEAAQGCGDGFWAAGWTDPPIAFVTADGISGPELPGGPHPRRVRDLPTNAHILARAPVETAGPS